jgi:hypothetical protein
VPSFSDGGVLFCTEVASMGTHTPGLTVGVSLGKTGVLSY